MKTVMKKMFCLLLVAVMMVGIMPFAAFAEDIECPDCFQIHDEDEVCCKLCQVVGHDETEAHCPECKWHIGHSDDCTSGCDKSAGCAWDKAHKDDCLSQAVCEHCGAEAEHFTDNCPNFCSLCQEEGHDETEAHCPECKWHIGHAEGCSNLKCEHCGQTAHEGDCCKKCKEVGHTDEDPHCIHCGKGAADEDEIAHPNTCPNSDDFYSTCEKCGERYETADGKHLDCDYCDVCWAKGDKVKTHKTADHCAECGNTDGTHKNTCSKAPQTGNATVKVHVRLHTSDVLTDTVELLSYKDNKNTRIYASVAAHEDLIRAKLAEKYPGYKWSGNLYDDPEVAEDTTETIGKGTTVYINVYSAQDLVYIYVHNSRSMSNLRIIQLNGKKVGETITKSEVKKAVSKYFNVNSISMYSEQAWEDYVDGDSVESVSSLKITTDPYFIDVKISGSAKSSSGSSYTADSSNPKTGDEIYAPVMILGLSASALAVLFYLNKKRAF